MNTPAPGNRGSLWLALALALVASVVIALVRFYPVGWWNLAAVGALSLFVGARIRSWWAVVLPLGLMVATDYWLSVAKPENDFPHFDTPFVYGSYLVIFALGRFLGQTENPWKLGALSFGGSILFFVVTNLGVWLNIAVLHNVIAVAPFIYEPNLSGLLLCYENGVPFYRGTLAGDLVVSAVLFVAYAALVRVVEEPAAQPEEVWS